MKKLVIAFAATALLSGAAWAKDASAVLKVSGWHCGGCAARTQKALEALPGVKEVKAAKAEEKTGVVEITWDDEKTTVADIEKAIEALKYKVEK